MNENNDIIGHLGYDGVLLSMSEVAARYPRYRDMVNLGADGCYFIAGHPAALFCKVPAFGCDYVKKIADVLHRAWNYRKVFLLIAYSDLEVRAYNCYSKPNYVADEKYEKEIKKAEIKSAGIKHQDFAFFKNLFSREALDTGVLWQAAPNAPNLDVSKRVDAFLLDSLDRAKKALLKEGLSESYIHALLIRSLFVLFLEDKGATADAGVYTAIMPGSKSYFDILSDKEATYKLFAVLNKQFNGDITHLCPGEKNMVQAKHLKIVRKCFMDGDLSDNPRMFGDWRLFRFDIIRIELLSEIYEHFLGASKITKATKGQYYTPSNLVDLILSEKIPADSKNWELKVLDPSCGSGIFLVESYKRLIRSWKNAHDTNTIEFQTLETILCDCIYGIDIDSTALSVAAFSLYLTLINELDPKTLWADGDHRLPCLIHDGKTKGEVKGHLWCADTIASDLVRMLPPIDLVVGNPPYGTHHGQQSIKDYCSEHGFANEMSLPFIHKVTSVCRSGEIALVVNMKILTNTNGTYATFRNWMLKEAYVEKLYNFSVFRNAPANFGGSLFSSASTPVAVLFYKSSRPKQPTDSITYWAPKTYVKPSMLYDIVLDSCDVKCLPRALCETNDARVWKIGAWGSMMAYRLVKKLDFFPTLKATFKERGWIYGRGCNSDCEHPDFVPKALLNLRYGRYYVSQDTITPNESEKPFRNNKAGIFDAPYVVMKECPDNEGVIAGLFDGDAVSTTSTFVFNGMSEEDKVILVTYLNSRLASSLLFLTCSTWGIERERLLLEDETLMLPSPFGMMKERQKKELVSLFETIKEKQSVVLQEEIDTEVGRIDQLFYEVFGLSDLDIEAVEDVYTNSLQLFAHQENSCAMKRVVLQDLKTYAIRLCESLNGLYRYSNTRVSPEVLVPNGSMPLDMVIVRFGDRTGKIRQLDSEEDRTLLKSIYRCQTTKPGDGITIRRILREYQENAIVLIKPSQRRYWTKIQALEDGASIFSEILAMKEVANG